MGTKTYKTLETPGGIGEIRQAGAHLAKVFYRLLVRQEISGVDVTPGQAAPLAALDIAGEVSISQDEPGQARVKTGMTSGDLLTLHLADGRRLEVLVTPGDLLTGDYQIVSGSPAGFISE